MRLSVALFLFVAVSINCHSQDRPDNNKKEGGGRINDIIPVGSKRRILSDHLEIQSWNNAINACNSNNTQLTTFTTSKIARLIATWIREKFGLVPYWVGGFYNQSQGTWQWLSGDIIPLSDSMWQIGEPNNSEVNSCLQLNSEGYSAKPCDSKLQYICETGCGGEYNSNNGTIRHPLNGGKYTNFEYCIWIIRADDPIKITFENFDTEGSYDYLYVRNGDNDKGILLGTFDGYYSEEHLPGPVTTITNTAYLLFLSEYIIVRSGFNLTWETYTYNPKECPLLQIAETQNEHGYLFSSHCTNVLCNNGNWSVYVDEECPKCKTYLDPHIVTYAHQWYSYSYQGCGNYSLSQFGNSSQPTSGVYATFEPCGGYSYLTCVDTVTFKEDEHTVITITFETNETKIQVNSEDYDVPSFLPESVQINEFLYPVLAWKSKSNCVNLQGRSSGILVRFCGSIWANEVYVWAYPSIGNQLEGLCGNINDDQFTNRGENMTWPWERNAPVEFALSWLASGNGTCKNGTLKLNRQAEKRCEANETVFNDNFRLCRDTVWSGFPDAEEEEAQAIIDDCVYDLCNVSGIFVDNWIRSVEQTVQVQANIQENTIELSIIIDPILPSTQVQTNAPTTQPPPTSLETYPPGKYKLSIGDSGIFTSIRFPKDYPNNDFSKWIFRCIGGTIKTNCFTRIQTSPECYKDKLVLFTGKGFKYGTRYCGRNNKFLGTFKNHLKAVFRSNPTTVNKGFHCVLECLP